MNQVIIILAAGASTRMGQAKQLLTYQEDALVVHAIRTAQATGLRVIVVTGNHHEAVERTIRQALEQTMPDIMLNGEWQEGMAASIRAGIRYAEQQVPGSDGYLLMTCDQPLITTEHLQRLVAAAQGTPDRIAATRYGDTRGVPVYFPATYRVNLSGITGDRGARSLLEKFKEHVIEVPFEAGAVDMDTPEDYQAFSTKYNYTK
ncbi:nucleotidyltransferase family protein [Flavihumibacter petaseus]|nr:nucleotidyltransferase family protein [Flavihumibacter petaseus]